MNELFSNEPNRLRFYIRVKGVLEEPVNEPDVTLVSGGIETELTAKKESKGVYSVAINSDLIHGRYAEVFFTYELDGYGTVTEKNKLEISRRIVSYDDVLSMVEGIEYDQYDELERVVRGMCEVYCKQSFNTWYGTRVVRGNEGVILLPQYLDKLDSLSKKISTKELYKISNRNDGYEIAEDGFSIENARCIELRRNIHGSSRESDFKVMGQWGYASVPSQVQQAAASIIQQKLCPDGVYRERYVDSIRNENINIKYNPRTYANSTGNADADKLLIKYRILSVGVS